MEQSKFKTILNKVIAIAKRMIKNPMFYVMVGLIAIDFISKWIVIANRGYLASHKIFLIPNFIYITYVTNTGAIFGAGSGQDWARIVLLIIRLLVALIAPVVYFYKDRSSVKKSYKVVILMIYAGCIGNLIDDMFYWNKAANINGVIDWIAFPFFMPNNNFVFNLADSYVTVGVVICIILLIIDEVKEVKEKNRRGEYSMTPEEYEKKMIEENKKKNGFNDKQ